MAHEIKHPPELLTLLGNSAVSQGIKAAMTLPAGARFYRCALQVNPFEYTSRYSKPSAYASEVDYNAAMVAACKKAGVEVVAVTDHFRISSSHSLIADLEDAGIIVFPGFEANSSEGIHLLCIFEPKTPLPDLERYIGACSLAEPNAGSPQSTRSVEQLMQLISGLGGLVIAAHACSTAGLLATLYGQSRGRAWRSDYLLAASLPGPREAAPQQYRDILMNKDATTKRPHPLCVINANDVTDPGDISSPSATTLIKMTSVSVEGLRQGFLDWESRVRLNSDSSDGEHLEIVAVSWDGGLFDEQFLRFNAGLNVLVGGRGAGKSTLIESLRYAFDAEPKGEEANRLHRAMIKNVLGAGSTVSVLMKLPNPSSHYYLVERIYGQRPSVRDQEGNILAEVMPEDAIGRIEIFGQHEISELTRYPDRLAEILRRFTGPETDTSDQRVDIQQRLERSRKDILAEVDEINRIDDALAVFPALLENLKRFAAVGLEEKLSEKTSLDAESRILDTAAQLSNDLWEAGRALTEGFPAPPLLPSEEVHLPNRVILEPLEGLTDEIERSKDRAARYLKGVSVRIKGKVEATRRAWTPFEEAANSRYKATVRKLESEGHEPKRFMAIKNQLDALKPKQAQRLSRVEKLTQLQEDRKGLLVEWEQLKAKDLRELERAARRVSRRLENRVRVQVRQNNSLGALEAILRSRVSGNINQPLEQLRARDSLGLSDLAEFIRQGAQALIKEYNFSQLGAEKIAEGGYALSLEVEECELPAEAVVELNVGSDSSPNWKALDDLSTGQKATAVLLLLLLESGSPLVVDQPEDDLDNRFIADSIVPAMRDEKRRRQFIFSSHNANIPVLGDAEQIVGLTPVVDGGLERTVVREDLCGSIDVDTIKNLVKDVLEGGEKAFATRRDKYGF